MAKRKHTYERAKRKRRALMRLKKAVLLAQNETAVVESKPETTAKAEA